MSNLVTIKAKDSFHQSGYGVLHSGQKLKNFPKKLAEDLEKAGLVKIVTGKEAEGAIDAEPAADPKDLTNENFVEDGGLKGAKGIGRDVKPEDEEKKAEDPANKAEKAAPENKGGGTPNRPSRNSRGPAKAQ